MGRAVVRVRPWLQQREANDLTGRQRSRVERHRITRVARHRVSRRIRVEPSDRPADGHMERRGTERDRRGHRARHDLDIHRLARRRYQLTDHRRPDLRPPQGCRSRSQSPRGSGAPHGVGACEVPLLRKAGFRMPKGAPADRINQANGLERDRARTSPCMRSGSNPAGRSISCSSRLRNRAPRTSSSRSSPRGSAERTSTSSMRSRPGTTRH